MRQVCPTITGLFFPHRNEIASLGVQNASCSRPMLNQRRFTWATVAGVEPPFASASSGWDVSNAGRHAARGACRPAFDTSQPLEAEANGGSTPATVAHVNL